MHHSEMLTFASAYVVITLSAPLYASVTIWILFETQACIIAKFHSSGEMFIKSETTRHNILLSDIDTTN